jgi:GT2 family glycosyltransferase
MDHSKPCISAVIIGIDVEKTIQDCIQSVRDANYPQDQIEIIYVDGGSSDRSVELANEVEGVKVLELNLEIPTPGRGRNAGWKLAKHNTIQFLDADTVMSPEWLNVSYPLLKEEVVAVCGKCAESNRYKNCYHLIGDIEWDGTTGEVDAFGGIVLVNSEALKGVGGFDDRLVAGEEPDLSYRMRKLGGKIIRISDLMVYHDINMTKFSQYWKRSVRSGYAYAEVASRYIHQEEKFWLEQCIRITLSVMLPWIMIFLGFFVGFPLTGIFVGLGLAFRNLRNIPKYKEKYQLTNQQSLVYMLHLSFVVYPQMVGVMKYFKDRKLSWL